MFCMDEPDRHPAFRAANDRTLEYAERSNGRLIPFVRLDLSEAPIEEATRCLDLGARGIKLHPRAQRFLLNDERLAPVFEIAAERRVPILIHGGRGLPPIADDLARLVDALPRGAADHRPRRHRRPRPALARRFAGKAGVLFDTSAWSPIDLLDFFRQVPPEQVLYASRLPVRPAAELAPDRAPDGAGRGLADDQIRAMLAGNANRIADGEPPLSRPARAARTRSRSRWSSRASTSTCRWRRRCSGCASRTRSACSASRSTRATSGTATPGARPHPGAARRRARPLARAARDRGRGREAALRRDVPPDPPRRHRGGDARCMTSRQRPHLRRALAGGHDAGRGAPRRARPDRHEGRLRRGPLRRVHGACRRRSASARASRWRTRSARR